MCTCVALNFDRFYFGRNMDLEGSFGERVVMAPRNFPLKGKCELNAGDHYAIMGMAAVVEGYPLFADAMNEKGLCMAGLNFPGNAVYCKENEQGKYRVSPFELIAWVLGRCDTVAEAEQLLRRTVLVDVPFSKSVPLTPLHWMVSDSSCSLVVEPMAEGLKIYKNPVGVLTNNPPFPYHLANLAGYAHLGAGTPKSGWTEDDRWLSMGLGGVGLPGDYSSPSRFVRTAFLKKNLWMTQEPTEQVDAFFRVLGAVAPPRGCVLSPQGKPHYTTYTCCMDVAEGQYICKKYGASDVFYYRMAAEEMRQKELLLKS